MSVLGRARRKLALLASPGESPASARTKAAPDPAIAREVKGYDRLKFQAGADLTIEGPLVVTRPTTFKRTTRLGAFTTINGGFIDHCRSIGRHCSIGQDVRIGEPNHPIDWASTSTFQYNASRYGWHPSADAFEPTDTKVRGKGFAGGPVTIGHDVWLGARVTLLRDVTIGHGAIVAAGAVVNKDVPPYAIVGGIPAKVIRYRFDEETIARLLASKWWEYTPNQLSGINFADVSGFLQHVERMRADGVVPTPAPIVRYSAS